MTELDALDEDSSHMRNKQGLVLSKIGQTMTTVVDGHVKNTLTQTRSDTTAESYSELKYLQVKSS